jgi:hypothetical protein
MGAEDLSLLNPYPKKTYEDYLAEYECHRLRSWNPIRLPKKKCAFFGLQIGSAGASHQPNRARLSRNPVHRIATIRDFGASFCTDIWREIP